MFCRFHGHHGSLLAGAGSIVAVVKDLVSVGIKAVIDGGASASERGHVVGLVLFHVHVVDCIVGNCGVVKWHVVGGHVVEGIVVGRGPERAHERVHLETWRQQLLLVAAPLADHPLLLGVLVVTAICRLVFRGPLALVPLSFDH